MNRIKKLSLTFAKLSIALLMLAAFLAPASTHADEVTIQTAAEARTFCIGTPPNGLGGQIRNQNGSERCIFTCVNSSGGTRECSLGVNRQMSDEGLLGQTKQNLVENWLGLDTGATAPQAGPCEANDNFFSFPTWYKYLSPVGNECEPQIGSLTDFWLIGAGILDILLRFGSLLAVGFIIWGGFRILTSQGDPNTIKESRDTILNAIIGLVVTIIAAIAINFTAGRFN